jgi:4-alpha-glucanotransferase
VEVAAETLAAILDALGAGQPPSRQPPRRRPPGGAPPARTAPPPPPGQTWGLTVQLYSVRSRGSWGHGDLRDLADLAAWCATGLGAGFVLINPLHAAEPLPPVSPSPYLPMSRRFLSPLYLRVEDIPEYARLTGSGRRLIDALAAPLRARNTTSELIDRDAVWRAKRSALEIVYRQPLTEPRLAGFERFLVQHGQPLADWSAWCALAEDHGPDWRAWPERLRDPRSAAVGAEREQLRGRARFHAWLQWLADEQLAAAQAAATAAGMPVGIITDLAVGAHPGGADSWSNAAYLVPGVSAGAPPDEFNQLGQDWGQAPWHPGRLAEAGYQPLAGLIGAALSRAGGLRVDHVMGLLRLWWVPAGMTPGQGTYVRYDHEGMVGVLAGAAAAASGLAIGEDLGTVDDWIRDYLATRGVLGTSMLWFEREPGGRPLPPGQWRRNCLATVGTHDMPPAAAFVSGEHVELRARLGLLAQSLDTERAASRAAVAAWQDALTREGLLPPGTRPDPAALTVALYGYLARTPSALIGVSLADAVGDRRQQNLPGTTTEYPNWRVPLCDAEGRPVLLDDLPDHPGVRAVVKAVS